MTAPSASKRTNVFDQGHLGNPVTVINSTTFGRVTTGRRGGTQPRVIQLGAEFFF